MIKLEPVESMKVPSPCCQEMSINSSGRDTAAITSTSEGGCPIILIKCSGGTK
jgi:hypothetical protein